MLLAYFDCPSGISGDMTLGALLDLDVPLDMLNEAVQSVLPGLRIEAQTVSRHGFRATLAAVLEPHHHHGHRHEHRHLSDILALLEKSTLSEENKRSAAEIFTLLAAAEAKVHGTDIESVHFHEVGAADSIADIVGAVVGLAHLGVQEFYASPIPTGCGTLKIAHGLCSIPAPATAELLRGVPLADSDVPFELTTPTGAALLKHYVTRFGPMPGMTLQRIGIGAGSRDLTAQANVLRICVGEKQAENNVETASNTESAWIVETNLDDVSGEIVGHCIERLWTLSPLDVWCTPIQMKKQRPGVTLTVLCRREQIEAVENTLFAETTTIGVRRWAVERTVLKREPCQIETPWGRLDAKRTTLSDGKMKIAPEFESARKLAEKHGVSVREILNSALGR